MGNVAEWIGSLGTVLTLGLGLWLLGERFATTASVMPHELSLGSTLRAGVAYVKNGGDEPVTRVMLALFTAGHYAEPMSGRADVTPFVESWDWLGSGETRKLAPEEADWHADLFPPQVRLEFTDMTRHRWLRNERGVLSRKARDSGPPGLAKGLALEMRRTSDC